ncbi:MAG: 1-deoxy-D-xylulose-5-phosphate reductoisomerase, partial [Muribaculaceae bacterium]|nr:1-deoxy-D-xylulose-5-phosphate reductoisomerase [Muribaculaceae bacterium]
MKSNVKNIAILGSTGSIGTQTLDIVEAYPELFRVGLLTAGSNARLLAEQARKFLPARVVIADEGQYAWLRDELAGLPVDVAAGQKAIAEAAAESDTDTVVTAMVGYSGLPPTLGALEAGKTIALANKETLVAGGEIVTRLARSRGADIVPVDSEHSAIF